MIRGTKNDHRVVAMPIDFKITLSWVIIVVTVGICTTKALDRLLTAKTVGRNALVNIKSPFYGHLILQELEGHER